MVNFALVGLDGSIETDYSDSTTNNEVNSINSESHIIDTTICELAMINNSFH